MKTIYIAGPYRGKTIYETLENIRAAEKVAIKYIKKGYLVYCPHMATRLFDGVMPDEFWLSYQMEWLNRCDCVVMMENWQESEGAMAEEQMALTCNKEIVYE